jgi:microcystin-dependent protein
MAESYIATIQAFAFNYAPRGWMLAQGQTLAISQYSAVFALMGTTYGGNGQTTFQVPNLGGRAPVGQGQLLGGGVYSMGEVQGTENAVLTSGNLPAHTHALMASGSTANSASPTAAGMLAVGQGTDQSSGNAVTVDIYGPPGTLTGLAAQSIGATGTSTPFSILSPLLVINYSVCLEGLFPSRN